MTAVAGTAVVEVEPDLRHLNKQLADSMSKSRLGKLGKVGGAAIAAGLVSTIGAGAAVGKVLYGIGEQFDDARDRIRVGTGKTGRGLRGLERDFKAVVRSVPTDFDAAGTAITDLSRRLGLTGRPLQRLSARVLELSRITRSDLREDIPAITRLFGDWSIRTDQQARTLDRLFRASQATGIGVSELSRFMVQFGSPLRQLGLGFDFSAAMFARFEKEGVNIQTLMPGLRMALKNFSAEGREPAAALRETFDAIRTTADTAKANQMAFRVFGARAGPDMAAAIREGRFDLDQLMRTMRGGRDTILRAGKDTMDFSERWLLFKNRVLVGLAPLADRVFGSVGNAMDSITRILDDRSLSNPEKLERVFDFLLDRLADVATDATELAARVGPRLVAALASGIAVSWTDMSPLAKLFTVGAIITAVGGRGAIISTGTALGRLLGGGIATGTATSLAGGAAAGAAAGAGGGLIAGMRSKLLPLARRAGLLGVGLVLADGVMDEFSNHAMTRSQDLFTRLKGQSDVTFGKTVSSMANDASFGLIGKDAFPEAQNARDVLATFRRMREQRVLLSQVEIRDLATKARALDLTNAQRAQVAGILSMLRSGSRLRLGVDLNMDPKKVRQFENGLGALRSGTLSNLQDILRVSRRNMRLIGETWGQGTAKGRDAAARNMRAAADAIETQMRRSGNVTNSGIQRVLALLRRADLLTPSRKMAADFGRGWAAGMDTSTEITKRGLRRMLAEARTMPGPMRKIALETWLAQVQAAQRNGRITQREFRDLRSRVTAEFTGMRRASADAARVVPSNVTGMADGATGGLTFLAENANKTLVAFGARPLVFSFGRVRAQRRQTGGVIVPGQGSGDKVPALLEPGEVVWNRRAVAAMGGPKTANAINGLIPRFQGGGIAGGAFNVDGAKPGFVPFMNYLNSLFGPLYVMSGLRPGSITTSGNVSNHAGGNAVDISTMQNGLNMAYNAATLNATGAAAARMDALYSHMARFIPTSTVSGDFLWRTDTGGNHWNHIHRGITNGLQDNPAAMAAFLSKLPEGGGFAALQRLLMVGPDGPLKTIGQGALDAVHKAASAFIAAQSSIPMFGTGSTQAVPHSGPGKVIGASTFGGPNDPGTGSTGYRDNSLIGQDAYAELRMGTALGGLPYRHPLSIAANGRQVTALKLDIGGGGDPIQGHSTDLDIWWETAHKLGLPDVWKGLVTVNGLMRGGIAQLLQGGGVAGRRGGGGILGAIDRTIRMNRRPFSRRQRARQLRKTLKLIDDIGLSPERQGALTTLANDADMFMDFAQRAGALSYELTYAERTPALLPDGRPILGADGKPTFYEPGDAVLDADRRPVTVFGQVGGLTEAGNTQRRLGALLELRDRLLAAEGTVRSEQLRTGGLIARTRERIDVIKRAIERAAKVRAEVRRQIRLVEREIKDMADKLTRARTRLEDERGRLESLRSEPRKNAAKIRESLGRIDSLRTTIAELRFGPDGIERKNSALDVLRDRNRVIGEQQQRRVGEREALNRILGDDDTGLLGKQNRLRSYYGEVLGTGGEAVPKGLVTVQGAGAPLDRILGVPPIGLLGGEVFDAQQLLAQLDVKPLAVPLPTFDTDPDSDRSDQDLSELLALQRDIATRADQRFAVSQAQYRVLEGFDLPPFGGSFATGGVVPGPAGAARTIIAHGGETIIPENGAAGGVQVLVVVEDGAVDKNKIRVIAQREVTNMTSRESRIAARRLPGLAGAR